MSLILTPTDLMGKFRANPSKKTIEELDSLIYRYLNNLTPNFRGFYVDKEEDIKYFRIDISEDLFVNKDLTYGQAEKLELQRLYAEAGWELVFVRPSDPGVSCRMHLRPAKEFENSFWEYFE